MKRTTGRRVGTKACQPAVWGSVRGDASLTVGRRSLVWGLVLILLLALALRIHHLDSKSLWYDELGTAMYTAPDRSPIDVVRSPREVPVIPAPPLYFLTTYLLRQVGVSKFLLRLPSVFYGVLAVASTFILGRVLLGPREGLLGAFLLAISTFAIRYSQEARYYALLLLLATFSLYFFYRGLCRNDRTSWLGFVVTSTLAVYTHLFAFLFLAVEGLYGAIYFLVSSPRTRAYSSRERTGPGWRDGSLLSFLVSVFVMALLYLPMLPQTAEALVSSRGLGGVIRPAISRESLSYLAGIVQLLGAGPGLPLLFYLLTVSLGAYFVARRGVKQLTLFLLWIVLPFLVVFLVPSGHNFRLRYVIFVLPVFLLVVSAGLVGLVEALSIWLSVTIARPKLATAVLRTVVAVVCLALAGFGLGALERYWCERKQPWDKAASFVQSVGGPDAFVITANEAHAHRVLYYGHDASQVRYLVPCPCPVKTTADDWYTFPELADGQKEAWLIDPSPSYERLMPGGRLAEGLGDYVFLPPIIFSGRSMSGIVEKDLLGPFMTSDVGVIPVLWRDTELAGGEIIALGSLLASKGEQLYLHGTRYEFTLGELHRFYGGDDEAIAHYRAAIADDPRYYPAYKGLALSHISQGEVQRAVELYLGLLEMRLIRGSDYHFLLGAVQLAEGDARAAIVEYTLAVRMDPRSVECRLGLGDAYRAAGELDQALTQYGDAIGLNPSCADAYGRRGSVYSAQGRLTEGVGEFRSALELRPNNPFYHAMLAGLYGKQGLLEEALAEATEAARLGGSQAAYHDLLAQIYRALGRASDDVTEAEEAVRLAPHVVSYRLNLGDAYRLAGRFQEAIAAYERVLELDPGNSTAARRLEELH